VLDDSIQEPLTEVDADVDTPTIVAAGAAAIAHAAAALLGDVFYTGVVAAAVVAVREGRVHPLRTIARTLPYARLAGADLLLAVVVAGGLVLLVVPGLVFLAWFALIAPAIEIEDRGVIDGFRRSRALVRGNTIRVLALILPILIINDLLASAVQSGALLAIGDTFVGDWVGAVGADLVTAPFYALAIVVIFFELRQSRRSIFAR
jgi:hypothetical protein